MDIELVVFAEYSWGFEPGVLPSIPKHENSRGIGKASGFVLIDNEMVGDVVVPFGIVSSCVSQTAEDVIVAAQ